jgi:methylthioribose-1-phosphate isomerase
MPVPTVEWIGEVDGFVRMIDQTLLPTEYKLIDLKEVEPIWEAIKMLRVRGAPALGISAAMGLCVGLQTSDATQFDPFWVDLKKVSDYIRTSRPTAVNLFWALDRMEGVAQSNKDKPVAEIRAILVDEAKTILEEDRAMCRAIGRNGAAIVPEGAGIITHCNAGGLATADYGTALAVMFSAHEQGKKIHVYADETRPLLQGARLTTWELMQEGIDVTLICDNMAAVVMREGKIQMAVTGADRIAANGDAANKIGTYTVALLCKAHDIPFYVAAPSSTFDLDTPSGDLIPIEERDPAEVTCGFGKQTAPDGVHVYSPAFDVTPAELIAALITERGVIENPTTEKVAEHLA